MKIVIECSWNLGNVVGQMLDSITSYNRPELMSMGEVP